MNGEEKKHLSFTQLSMFLRCPRQYCYRYIEGIKIPPSGAMVQSRVWHQTVERNYNQKIESDNDLPLDEMQDFFAETFDNTFSTEEIVFDSDDAPSLKDQGTQIVEIHHKEIAPSVKPKLVEEKFTVDLGDDFPFNLVGVWDVIERDGIIADNKAYGKTPNQDDFNKDLQFTAYALGYRTLFGKLEQHLRMDAVVKTKKIKTVQLVTTRTNQDCRWLLGLIEQVGMSIINEMFFPNPNGWHCSPKFCGYWDLCKK